MSIKRYDLIYDGNGDSLVEAKNGTLVIYRAHRDLVYELERENKVLREELEDVREGLGERDRYKKALEEIITLNQSAVGDYPVLKSDGEMFKIAKEAIDE